MFVKCHLKLLIDITLHYITRALETATCGGRRRYDQLVSVRYHRDHFDDLQDLASHGDFIDDDHLLQHRLPPPAAAAGNDVTVTSHDRRRQSPVTSECIGGRVILLLLIGIPSPTLSFIPGLKPPFLANPSHCSPSSFFLNIYYVDLPDCLLLFLSTGLSVFYF